MKCFSHSIVNDLNQDLRAWSDCTAPLWTLSTSKQGFQGHWWIWGLGACACDTLTGKAAI